MYHVVFFSIRMDSGEIAALTNLVNNVFAVWTVSFLYIETKSVYGV